MYILVCYTNPPQTYSTTSVSDRGRRIQFTCRRPALHQKAYIYVLLGSLSRRITLKGFVISIGFNLEKQTPLSWMRDARNVIMGRGERVAETRWRLWCWGSRWVAEGGRLGLTKRRPTSRCGYTHAALLMPSLCGTLLSASVVGRIYRV